MRPVARFIAPWPPKALSPNERPSRFEKIGATKSYRRLVYGLALEAGVHRCRQARDITITFCPIGRGPAPDRDNAIASFKAGQDGIADALAVNDRDLTVRHIMGERCKDGAVIITVEAI